MARYQCGICGYIFDEEKEGKLFSELEKCPVCGHSPDNLRLLEEQPAAVPETETAEAGTQTGLKAAGETEAPAGAACADENSEPQTFAYPEKWRRQDENIRYMAQIHEMAVSGKPLIEALNLTHKILTGN